MISEDPAVERSASQFGVRPHTLFDDEYLNEDDPPADKEDEDPGWLDMVQQLQKENQTLLDSLRKCHDSLLQCRQDKAQLEEILQNQKKRTLDQELEEHLDRDNASDTSWRRSDIEHLVDQVELQQNQANKLRADLLFQKRYLTLANRSLEASEQEALSMLSEMGVAKVPLTQTPVQKWRACFWAILAVHRFRNSR
ncbi:hypothetical protein BC940DRAFT_321017 [Gongronella butleri]|nr:hypothetical protein BC940DRAFT_321017 [Gongronella butleri]